MAQNLLKWMILLVLVLFIVAVSIFLFGKPSFSEDKVSLELDGPSQASAGDEIVYRLKYKNNTNLDLNSLKFKFSYPEGSIVIKDGKVEKNLSETFTVEKLKDGESGEKEFSAFLTGDRGNIKNAKIELEFNAGNLRSSFEKSDTVSTTLVSVPVSLTLAVPPTVVSGQVINYIFDYRNESGEDISDVGFMFNYPEGFTLQEQTPKPSDKNTWSVPVLKQGNSGRITIKGILKGREGEIKSISVSMKRGINGERIDYQKVVASSLISNPLLGIEVLVNDSKNYSAHLGDRLQYSIKYKNNSDYNLIGLNLEAKLDGEMYDIATLDTNGGFYDSSNGIIIWNSSSVPDFSSMQPNKSGEIKFSVNVKNSFPSGSIGGRNFFVKAAARLRTQNVPSGVDGNEISALSEQITPISTQPTLKQTVFYNDSAFGSSGPLPPQVGKETLFTVHWQITNPGNDMNNAEVGAILPAGVIWKNVVSVGLGQSEPTFNANTSEVIWNIGVLPQSTGILTPKYEASFQIGIKPSVAGQAPVILKDGKFSGTDSFTKEKIILNLPDINTNELTDRPGEGEVK